MAFKINDSILGNLNRVVDTAQKAQAQDRFRIEHISVDDILASDKNFYAIENIDELAEDIGEHGLLHNIVVRPTENGKYEIISGERRFSAIKQLYDKLGDDYKFVPAKVVEADDVEAEVMLINANRLTRTISMTEKLKQVDILTKLYEGKKDNGEMLGDKTRELIGQELGISGRQVSKYQQINKNLDDTVKEQLDDISMNVNEVAKIAALPKEEQYDEFIKRTNEKEKKIKSAAVPDIEPEEAPIKESKVENNQRREVNALRVNFTYWCPVCGYSVSGAASTYRLTCDKCNEQLIVSEL